MRRGRSSGRRFVSASGPLVDAARQTQEARVFEWFAQGEARPRERGGPRTAAIVELDDMRFGVPGRRRTGSGESASGSTGGRPIGPGERFRRERSGAPVGEALRPVWRETLGIR